MSSPASIRRLLVGLQIVTLFFLPALAQQHPGRLILKDGSYQSVTKYEVKGDRVRYLSAERNEWEELPSSLVDWPATEKFEKERTAPSAIPEAALIDRESEAGEARLPQVAPGLRLPELSGMFLLDNFKGQAQLIELQQNQGDVNRSAKGNIFRGPIAGAKATIELEGEHAAIYAHVAVPSIYIRMEDDSPDTPPPGETASAKPSMPSLDAPRAEPQHTEQPQPSSDNFRIVRVKVQHGKRIIGDIKRSPTGKLSQEQNSVKTTTDRIGAGWLKLTPTEDLPPGEYAIVETKGTEAMNLYVWPFAVNPHAPANPNPWTPDVKEKEKDKNEANEAKDKS